MDEKTVNRSKKRDNEINTETSNFLKHTGLNLDTDNYNSMTLSWALMLFVFLLAIRFDLSVPGRLSSLWPDSPTIQRLCFV